MRRSLLITLTFLSLVILLIRFGVSPLERILGISDKAGIKVDSNPSSQLSIDSKVVGQTPIQKEDLTPEEHLISLKNGDSSWQSYVKLNSGTLTIINRDLSPTLASSSGEIISLMPGSGVTVTSNPSGSDLSIDSQIVGKTPISLPLSPGEHQFTIAHPDFQSRSVRAVESPDYNLTLNVDLAISEVDLSNLSTPTISVSSQVVVKATPGGFLRVRDSASINGVEIARVNPGDTLTLLQELSGWDKIKLPDGREGYVSSQYVDKK